MVLLALSIIMGAYIGDFTWIVVGIFGLIIFLLPRFITGTWSATYSWKIFAPIPFFLIAFLILGTTGKASLFEELWPISIGIQVIVTMMLGYLTLLNVDMHTKSKISKQWLLIFALLIACTLSALYSFYVFAMMISLGYPVSSDDFINNITKGESNLMSMMQMTVATFVSVVYAFIMRYYLRNVSKEELSTYNVGDAQ